MAASTTTTKASTTSRAISKEDIEGFAKLLQSLLKPLIAFLTVAIPFLYVVSMQTKNDDDISSLLTRCGSTSS
jgi:hypothetical protein